jgi:hypothetical protein
LDSYFSGYVFYSSSRVLPFSSPTKYIFFTKEPTENQYQEGLEVACKAAMKFKKSEKSPKNR